MEKVKIVVADINRVSKNIEEGSKASCRCFGLKVSKEVYNENTSREVKERGKNDISA